MPPSGESQQSWWPEVKVSGISRTLKSHRKEPGWTDVPFLHTALFLMLFQVFPACLRKPRASQESVPVALGYQLVSSACPSIPVPLFSSPMSSFPFSQLVSAAPTSC